MRSIIRNWLSCSMVVAGIGVAMAYVPSVQAQGGMPGGAGGNPGGAGGNPGGPGGSASGSNPFGSVAGGSGGGGASGSSTVDKTNALGPTFSNPLYMGRPNQTLTITTSGANTTGGSGSSSSSGSGSSSGGTALTTTNVTKGAGGFGSPSFGSSGSATGATSRGGVGGGAGGSSVKAAAFAGATPVATKISYSATLKFPTKPIVASEFVTELSDIINRSSSITNPAAIQVGIDQQTIVLRGKVANDDERRLAENLIRLTPHVRSVRNELEVP